MSTYTSSFVVVELDGDKTVDEIIQIVRQTIRRTAGRLFVTLDSKGNVIDLGRTSRVPHRHVRIYPMVVGGERAIFLHGRTYDMVRVGPIYWHVPVLTTRHKPKEVEASVQRFAKHMRRVVAKL